MTVGDWLSEARAQLAPLIGADAAAREARLILMRATGWGPARAGLAGAEGLAASAKAVADGMLARRLTHEPLAQIFGEWAFFGRSFSVTRDTLVPRSDTETLIELALAEPYERVIDLGTGSGAIAVTLLAECAQAQAVASDLSPQALAVAAENAARHGVSERITLVQSDWWAGITGAFDLVVSNPPYVSEAAYAGLAPDVTAWEPRMALTPGGDGLLAYRVLLAEIDSHLKVGGRSMMEIGYDQGPAVAALFEAAGLEEITVHADINGRPRVVSGRKAAGPKGG